MAWHTKEATPPWTPVWSSGVRVNLGVAVWNNAIEKLGQVQSWCVCVCTHVKNIGDEKFSTDGLHNALHRTTHHHQSYINDSSHMDYRVYLL